MNSETWTQDIINNAINTYNINQIAPVVIISYKRGSKASSIQLMKNSNVPTYLFVYDDDIQNYKEVENYNNFTIVKCPSAQFRGAAKKRDYVQKIMYNSGIKDYFILDDDITKLYYTKPGTTKAGKYKAEKTEMSPDNFFRTWYYVIHNCLDYKPALGGIISENSSWCQDLYKLPIATKTGRICQIAYINTMLFNKHNIKYNNIEAWDDFDVQLQIYKAGLNTCSIGWLTYSGDTMTPKKSIASGGDYTWTKKSMNLYKTWGEYVGFKVDKGQLNSTFKWSKIKKDLKEKGTLIPQYNLEWEPYIFPNSTSKEVDYIGFTKLWQNEIDKWNYKHLSKKQLEQLYNKDESLITTIKGDNNDLNNIFDGQLSLFDNLNKGDNND